MVTVFQFFMTYEFSFKWYANDIGQLYHTQLPARCLLFTPCFACSKSLTCHYPGWAPQCSTCQSAQSSSGSVWPAVLLQDKLTTLPSSAVGAVLTLKWLTLQTHTHIQTCTSTHTYIERESHPPANPLLINPPPLSSNIPFC